MTNTPIETDTPLKTDDFSAKQFFSEWWFSLLVLVIIFTTASFGDSLTQALSLKREMISQGEWWRIITGQFVHLTTNHTLLNATGYIILCFGFRKEVTATEEMITLFIATIGVGLGIYWFNPEMAWYAGLSGAIYGLLVSNAMIGAKKTPYLSAFFLFFVTTKIIYEQFFAEPDRATAALIGGEVAIDSHLYGAIVGIIPGAFWVWRRRVQN
ncbi:rhombosortase [Gammaproteobacteria bacterium 42_54_T18]|nr:rhombosortase [Gammaproteobacteria bacterium 42_54_T18]